MKVVLAATLGVAIACGGSRQGPRTAALGDDPAAFVRMRCATDGSDVWMVWTGQVRAVMPDESAVLFRVQGASVARCFRDADGSWRMTSRELMYYLDPATGQVLHRWHNPWTDATVAVVHVANDPVQQTFSRTRDIPVEDGVARYDVAFALSYPNPLAASPALRRFSPQPVYRARESFGFRASARELADPTATQATAVSVTWHRRGPWLPWMDMGERPGYLEYEADGRKVAGMRSLPAAMRDDIRDRVPRFRAAPHCWLDTPNATTWTYFAAHVDDYLAGARFPVPDSAADPPCRGEDAHEMTKLFAR